MRIAFNTVSFVAMTCTLVLSGPALGQSLSANCQQKLLGLASVLSEYQLIKAQLAEKRSEFGALDQKKAAGTITADEEANWTALRQAIYLQEQKVPALGERLEAVAASTNTACQE